MKTASIHLTGKTVAERYAEFRATIEPELEAHRKTDWNNVTVSEISRRGGRIKQVRKWKKKDGSG